MIFRRRWGRFWLFCGVGCLCVGRVFAQSVDPEISEDVLQKILNLPFGVANQKSLILRSKHVDIVQFYGSGLQSRRGFVIQNGIIREGLWLELKNRGDQPWASAAIKLRAPMDIRSYDSMVIWARANLMKQKLSVGFQDPSWSKIGLAQTRTEVFPNKGFVSGDLVQVTIPFRMFSTGSSFDYSKLSHITFEFGTQSTGNSLFGSLDILGVAFVKQDQSLASIKILKPSDAVTAMADAPTKVPNKTGAVPLPISKPSSVKPQEPGRTSLLSWAFQHWEPKFTLMLMRLNPPSLFLLHHPRSLKISKWLIQAPERSPRPRPRAKQNPSLIGNSWMAPVPNGFCSPSFLYF